MYQPYFRNLRTKARYNRKHQTRAEKLMWHLLRGRRFENFKFTRQKSIGNCIVDFYCAKLQLALEIDGDVHKFQEEHDAVRSEVLKRDYGVMVVRYTNEQVLRETDRVLRHLKEVCDSLLSAKRGGLGW